MNKPDNQSLSDELGKVLAEQDNALAKLLAERDEQNGFGPKADALADEILQKIRDAGYKGYEHSIIGALLNKFGHSLKAEWSIEKYWAHVADQWLPKLDDIYEKLLHLEATAENRFEFNDLDDHFWVVPLPHPELEIEGHVYGQRKAFIYTSQNHNLLFLWEKTYPSFGLCRDVLHIRRYWDKYVLDEYNQDDDQEFRDKVAKEGFTACLSAMNVDWYADDVTGNSYPQKPSLEFFEKNEFKFQYNDGRDKGYVLTYQRDSRQADWAIHHHKMLQSIFECYLPSIECALEEGK